MESDVVSMKDLRGPYESNTEWRLRHIFLEKHKDKYPQDRLVCLSNCFINVEVYGCRYPRLVMDELKQLTASLPQEHLKSRSKVKGNIKISFVKASEDLSESSVSITNYIPSSSNARPEKVVRCSDRGFMKFVKSDSDFHSIDISLKQQNDVKRKITSDSGHREPKPKSLKVSGGKIKEPPSRLSENQQEDGMDKKFNFLASQIKLIRDTDRNAIEIIHQAADKVKMSVTFTIDACTSDVGVLSFVCFVQIDFVEISMGAGSNKKIAKHNAFTKALEKLSHLYCRVFEIGEARKALEASNNPFQDRDCHADMEEEKQGSSDESTEETFESNEKNLGAASKSKMSSDLNDFFILESDIPTYVSNPVSVIRQSADFNKVLLRFILRSQECTIKLCDHIIAVASGETKKIAKTLASERALEKLRQICWTIQIKQATDSDAPELTKADVMGEVQKELERIPDSNIGNQLLRKMGWSGGGVGREGRKGIADPVIVTQIINREGLGSSSEKGIHVDFLSKVRDVILNYTKSYEQKDLVFSSDFTKDERAIIHRESKKYGLRSTSRGTGEKRYLTIGRKRTAGQLFEHITQNGGSTDKYLLVPPQGSN